MKRKKLIYTHVGLSSFVRKDIEILQDSFDVKIYYFSLKSKRLMPWEFFKQFIFLCFNLPLNNATVTQFAGYQSYLPTLLSRLMGKKAILVLGGTDTVSFPSIQYGCFYNKKLSKFTRKSLIKATLLLPVSETLIQYNYSYTDSDFKQQGYLFHEPRATSDAITIYNGYSADKWPFDIDKEPKSFVTVGADLGTRFGKILKGIDLILNVATDFPDCKFYVVGGDKLKDELPPNVIPVGNMPHEELPGFLGSKQYYLQLSMSEGFPNALSEAMLCGCVPIVSRVGAMPFIVDDIGYILDQKNLNLLKKIIHQAINEYTIGLAQKARKRIEENFRLSKRKEDLTNVIQSHLQMK